MQRIYLGTIASPILDFPLTGGKIGDQVTVDAELFTSDPDENGEGEGLDIISLPSLKASLSQYYFKKQFTFNIAKDGQTVSANINGNDGDENASLSIVIDPAPPKGTPTPEEKEDYAAKAEKQELIAAASDAAAQACERLHLPKNICVAFAVNSVVAGFLAQLDKELALDPPDPNFTVIDIPVTPSLPLLSLAPDITQDEVDSFNDLLLNQEKAIGLYHSLITSLNRAVGAYDANNDVYEAKQRSAAAEYSFQLSILMREQAVLLQNWQAALTRAGNAVISISQSDVLNNEINLIKFGLPSTYVQQLQTLGADATTIESIRNLHRVQDISVVAGNFPEKIANMGLIDSINKTVDSFLGTALGNAPPLAKGQRASGKGSAETNIGTIFEFEVGLENDDDKKGRLMDGNFSLRDKTTGFYAKSTQFSHAVIIGERTIGIEGSYKANDGSNGTFRLIATDSIRHRAGLDSIYIVLSDGHKIFAKIRNGYVLVKGKIGDDRRD